MKKFLLITLLVIGCDKPSPTSTSTNQEDETSTNTAYNLETCSTEIDNDVPDFFKKYFHCVTAKMSESGNYVNIYFNGKPPYESWYYSSNHSNYTAFVSQGNGYYKNPHTISESSLVISIPINPIPISNHQIGQNAVDGDISTDVYEYPMNSIGTALNGVHLFNPLAGPGDAIEDEAYSFDLYFGHPENQGNYHYHTKTPGPLEVLQYKLPSHVTQTIPGTAEIELYGIMCDGTVIMGCTELDKSNPNFYQLDAQNGHVHDMIDEAGETLLVNRYHTHICHDVITNQDTDGNGYQEHEFTPESSYYISTGTGNNNVCGAMSSPIEPDR